MKISTEKKKQGLKYNTSFTFDRKKVEDAQFKRIFLTGEYKSKKMEDAFRRSINGRFHLRQIIILLVMSICNFLWGILDVMTDFPFLTFLAVLICRVISVIATTLAFFLVICFYKNRKIVEYTVNLAVFLVGAYMFVLVTMSKLSIISSSVSLPLGTLSGLFVCVFFRLSRLQMWLLFPILFGIEIFVVFICHFLGWMRYHVSWNLGLSSAVVYGIVFIVVYFQTSLLEDFSRNKFELEMRLKKRRKQLDEELKKSKLLICNIFPSFLVDEMCSNINERFLIKFDSSIIVSESDLVNFTKFSNFLESKQLCEILNSIFSDFDRIIGSREGNEKLKTVGDSFIFFNFNSNSLQIILTCCEMLLALRKVNKNYKTRLEIRIGIAKGVCILGVLGTDKRITIDLFGTALHKAVEREKHSKNNAINVCEKIYEETKEIIEYGTNNIENFQNENNNISKIINYYPIVDVSEIKKLSKKKEYRKNSFKKMNLFDMEESFNSNLIHNNKAMKNNKVKLKDNRVNYLTTFPSKNVLKFLQYSHKTGFERYMRWIFFILVLISISNTGASILYNPGLYNTIPIIIFWSQGAFLLAIAIAFCFKFVSKNYFVGLFLTILSCLSGYLLFVGFFLMDKEHVEGIVGCLSLFVSASSILFPNIPYFIFAIMDIPVFIIGGVLFYYVFGFDFPLGVVLNYYLTLTVAFLIALVNLYVINISTSFSFVLGNKLQREIYEINKEKENHRSLLTSAIPSKFVDRFLSLNLKDLLSEVSVDKFRKTKIGLAKGEIGAVFFVKIKLFEKGELINKIRTLNKFFIKFDDILEKHRCTKIKSYIWNYLGISYGFSENVVLHNCLDCLLEIQEKTEKEIKEKGVFSIGVSFGKFSTAIIGQSKWLHDVFGSTVNYAARLAESASPSEIHCCDSISKNMGFSYHFRKHKKVEMKGLSNKDTYSVLNKMASIIEVK